MNDHNNTQIQGTEVVGCDDIAKALQSMMTMANFSSYIKQSNAGPLKQFSISSIEGTLEGTGIYVKFAGQGFKIDISFDPM